MVVVMMDHVLVLVKLEMSVLPYDMSQFYNELAFFIFLRLDVCLFIFPANSCATVVTVDVSNSMRASVEHSLHGWAARDVDDSVEQVGPSSVALEGPGH